MNFGAVIHLNKTGIAILCGLVLIFLFYSMHKDDNNERNTGKVNLHKLLEVAIKAAENGGERVIEIKDNINIETKGLTKEGLQDRVTTADFLSHCTMIATIKQIYPSIRVISEEAKTSCINNESINYLTLNGPPIKMVLPDQEVDEDDVTLWIDPLDATQEYTEKLYKYVTTMVCVAVKGKPIIGVVHKPFSKITTWAWDGKVVSDDLNQREPIKKVDDKIKIIVSRSHQGEIKKILDRNFENFELIVAAGAGYKAVEVASGKVNAYLHSTAIKKWDICAGNAILNALGGKMTNKYGKEIDYTDDTNVVNKDGLVATLRNHKDYLGRL